MKLNVMAKFITYFTDIFSNIRVVSIITSQAILWNNKPIRKHSVLLWDLENIPFNRLNDIKKLAKYTPEDLYIITKQPLGDKLRLEIYEQYFKIMDTHKTISDDKIISMMKLFSDKTDMILISSDSDFVKEASKYLKKNKMQWIVLDLQKKRVMMKIDISNKNLTISTLGSIGLPNSKQKAKKAIDSQKTIKTKIDSKYGIFQYLLYIFGVLKRSYIIMIKHIKFIVKPPIPIKTNETIQVHDNGIEKPFVLTKRINKSYEFKRPVYRYNYKSKRVICGKIYVYSKKQYTLNMYRRLQSKYDMPKFDGKIKFNEFEEVNHLIHYNEEKKEYFLNEFSRADLEI